jgi:hypothetical protein
MTDAQFLELELKKYDEEKTLDLLLEEKHMGELATLIRRRNSTFINSYNIAKAIQMISRAYLNDGDEWQGELGELCSTRRIFDNRCIATEAMGKEWIPPYDLTKELIEAHKIFYVFSKSKTPDIFFAHTDRLSDDESTDDELDTYLNRFEKSLKEEENLPFSEYVKSEMCWGKNNIKRFTNFP